MAESPRPDGAIRAANERDAEGVARVHVVSWQAAYREVLPHDFLDGLSVPDRCAFWARELRRGPGGGVRTWVAEREGRVAAFASSGPLRDQDVGRQRSREVYCLYVHPDLWGTGLGRRLMQHVVSDADDSQADLFLWVLASNSRARRFYQRNGFAYDGHEKVTSIGGVEVVEVRYCRPLWHLAS